ncbi:MAG: FAD-dependent oxidoreductase [Clostridia bacterium]|nr:FAD-dependent oxidoreductase [Clostridia bacterium]
MRVIIVGGVAGGASAAARIRRLDERAEIVIYERSGYISYANCGLPYYIGGIIEDRDDLTVQTPEGFRKRFQIDARPHHEVTDVDAQNKTVTVRDLLSGKSFTDHYDKLLLSPGAKPVLPDYPWITQKNVFTLRTVEDTLRIRAYAEERHVKRAVIVGGGFIGLETAENLMAKGISVTILQRGDQLLPMLDRDMASFIHAKLRAKGAAVVLGADAATHACIGEADMIVVAVGVTPETTLARAIGLRTGKKGAISVNDRMETSHPDIYAVGDAVEIRHRVTGEILPIALAGPANKQGRIAADNICGRESHYAGSLSSSVIKLFDMTAAATGINEKTAKRLGLSYERVVLSPASHAGYYPGARVMTMKVLYEKSTERLLGAQIVGTDGVDKRIDVLATAIFAGLPATALKDLDLAYAPPYSSAKDPVNMAGFIIDNIESGLVAQFHHDELPHIRTLENTCLLDTRTPTEYARGHADGFINIPLDELRNRLHELDPSKRIYIMCQSGLRSYLSARILSENGFDCCHFSGGYRFYESVLLDREAAATAHPCGAEK